MFIEFTLKNSMNVCLLFIVTFIPRSSQCRKLNDERKEKDEEQKKCDDTDTLLRE